MQAYRLVGLVGKEGEVCISRGIYLTASTLAYLLGTGPHSMQGGRPWMGIDHVLHGEAEHLNLLDENYLFCFNTADKLFKWFNKLGIDHIEEYNVSYVLIELDVNQDDMASSAYQSVCNKARIQGWRTVPFKEVQALRQKNDIRIAIEINHPTCNLSFVAAINMKANQCKNLIGLRLNDDSS